MKNARTLTVGAVAALAVLTACGTTPVARADAAPVSLVASSARLAATTAVPDDVNSFDVRFAQMMIVHHEAAIAMADLAADQAQSQEVTDLAARIASTQQDEVDTMTAWLESWGVEAFDSDDMPGMGSGYGMGYGMGSGYGMGYGMGSGYGMGARYGRGGYGAGGMGMMGATTGSCLLDDVTGAEFDVLFLQRMIVHHERGVAMADAEVRLGSFADEVALATTMAADQTAEIAQMQDLLDELTAS